MFRMFRVCFLGLMFFVKVYGFQGLGFLGYLFFKV